MLMDSRTRSFVTRTLAIGLLVAAGFATACSAEPKPVTDPMVLGLQPEMEKAGSAEVPRGAKAEPLGYYRSPTIHGDTIVFVSEGDLWKVPTTGGVARRMTTHHGVESNPVISPDGSKIAFRAAYEGPSELYTMPIKGGLPMRHTFDAWTSTPVNWTKDGRIIFATSLYSTLPNTQLVILDPNTGERERIPLWQAGSGSYDDNEDTLFFHRLGQGSHTKRYKGGTAHQIWKFDGENEAVPLTEDYPGTNRDPMWYDGRVYFASDRDDTMNIWSMNENGGDLRQHTNHVGWEIRSPSHHDGQIVYQRGADLRVYDMAADTDTLVSILLDTDFDQMREKWISTPTSWISSAHVSEEGDAVVMTARGEIFVTPAKQGRMVHVTRRPDVRYRDARFLPGTDGLVALSDESGEVELWSIPADGMNEGTQLTDDGDVLRWMAVPSPDGKWIAHSDKHFRL